LLVTSTTPGAEALITAPGGGRLGTLDGIDINELICFDQGCRGSGVLIPPVGGPAAGYGYLIHPNAYEGGKLTVSLTRPPDSSLSATFFHDSKVVAYYHEDADSSAVDLLAYEGGLLEVINDGLEAFTFWIESILTDVNEGTGKGAAERVEYVATVEEATVQPGEMLEVHVLAEGTLRVHGTGTSDGTYTVQLQRVSTEGRAAFRSSGIALGAGAVHTFRLAVPRRGRGGRGSRRRRRRLGGRNAGPGERSLKHHHERTASTDRCSNGHPADAQLSESI
jgi:hypothetical protein